MYFSTSGIQPVYHRKKQNIGVFNVQSAPLAPQPSVGDVTEDFRMCCCQRHHQRVLLASEETGDVVGEDEMRRSNRMGKHGIKKGAGHRRSAKGHSAAHIFCWSQIVWASFQQAAVKAKEAKNTWPTIIEGRGRHSHNALLWGRIYFPSVALQNRNSSYRNGKVIFNTDRKLRRIICD